jgi:ubiquinone/menaquinone biosynthesis C-methylase UbiE
MPLRSFTSSDKALRERLVGPEGRVVAVDVQPKMVEGLQKRARRAGLSDRIEARVAPAATMALDAYDNAVDFVLAFAVVHETRSAERFFAEAARAMKPGASLLLAEPAGHVSEQSIRDGCRVYRLAPDWGPARALGFCRAAWIERHHSDRAPSLHGQHRRAT